MAGCVLKGPLVWNSLGTFCRKRRGGRELGGVVSEADCT